MNPDPLPISAVSVQPEDASWRPIVHRVSFIIAGLACLGPWATPGLALAAGAVFALTFENPYPRVGRHLSKRLLQTCVVLLGFQMDFGQLVRVGADGWIFAAFSITLTLGLGWLVGRLLSLGGRISALISAGTAICGGSAMAAVGPVIGASEAEMAIAMATVFMLNAVALYVFPMIGHVLHLTSEQFGLWSGIAIHDISSVVGAASTYSSQALQVATAVKLSRTLWIVPVTLAAAFAIRARHGHSGAASRAKTAIPWFIGLFVLASLARLALPAILPWTPAIGRVARTGLTATLFLIGAGLSRSQLRSAGWRAIVQGICLWLVISAVSLGVIVRLMH